VERTRSVSLLSRERREVANWAENFIMAARVWGRCRRT
jgi:hypothetical protein